MKYNKLIKMFILLPVMVLLFIAVYSFYTAFIGDDPFKQYLNHYMLNKQIVMMFSAVMILLSVIIIFTIIHFFSTLDRDNNTLKNIVKNLAKESDIEKKNSIQDILEKDKSEIYEYLSTYIDTIEEDKRLAEQANQSKSQFLANMSHEIRTPLNGIVGFTDLLRSSGLNSEQSEFVQIIEKSSENLLSVINDILDLSKIESEKIDIEEIEFDPIVEFESGIESYGAKASEKNIDFGFYMDPTLSNKLIGDPNKIKQVLVNLISNAVKFTPEGGEIDIVIEKTHNFMNESIVRFSVKDSGIGISLEQRKKIFEAFSQADSSTSRKFGGTGLGLTISKKLVELMGGNLDLESEDGKGSTFFFTLTFEEIPSELKNKTFEDVSIGYYLPHNYTSKQSDLYVNRYISVLNPYYQIFDTMESLVLLAENEQPDLLFLNFDNVANVEMAQLKTLKSKIVIMTSINNKNKIKTMDIGFFKTLYAPINFSKIKNTLHDLNSVGHTENIEDKSNKYTNIKVLVAEDNFINQKVIKLTLENMGLRVTLANNGKEAFDLRCKETFDVIFMDIQMPMMNGIEATHKIIAYEKEKKLSHIPIVALTANALKGDKERFLEDGMDQYLSKPIKLDEIRAILDIYFKDKEKNTAKDYLDKTIAPIEEDVANEPVDILLCKKEKGDLLIFDALLKEKGYSVDTSRNIEDLKNKIQSKKYAHVLFDRNLEGLSEDKEISQMMKDLSIKSILLVEDKHLVREEDYENYTRVILNIANIRFLDHIIKLDLK